MYFLDYGNEEIHDPYSKEKRAYDIKLEFKRNNCGYLDFTIGINHPLAKEIKERSGYIVKLYKDRKILFKGEIYNIDSSLTSEDITISCKGDLDVLNSSIIPYYSTKEEKVGYEKVGNSIFDLANWYINKHNEQVSEDKQVILGKISALGVSDAESNSEYSTFNELYDNILEPFNCYISKRYDKNGRIIIDILNILK